MKIISLLVATAVITSGHLASASVLRATPLNIHQSSKFVSNSNFFADIPAQTKSRQYAWLETENTNRAKFLVDSKSELANVLQTSTQLQTIEAFMMASLPADIAMVSETVVDQSRKFILSQKNYYSQVHDQSGKASNLIFSAETLKPDRAEAISLSLSPSKKYLVIQVQLNGNIDFSRYFVYDVLNQKMKDSFDGLSYMIKPSWHSEDELVFMHSDSSPRLMSVVILNLADMKSKILLNYEVIKFNDWICLTSQAAGHSIFKNFSTGKSFTANKAIGYTSIIAETDAAFYFVGHADNDGTVFRLKKVDQSTPERIIPPKAEHWTGSISTVDSKYILVNYSRDSIVTLGLFDLDGKKVSEISLPDNYDLSSVAFDSNGILQTTVANFLAQTFQLSWDLQKPETIDFSILPQKFISSGIEIVSRLEYFKSKDGVLIPARLVYLASTKLSPQTPTYIDSYGGFNYISGYLTPWLSKVKIKFLKQGGLLVGTAIRGGAERGYEWYLAGAGRNKANSMHDLIGIANGLVERGYTQNKKIVSTGTSMGGYVAAAAAQMSPSSFGLVIPISGFHDQLGFMELDKWGVSWTDDLLNPYVKGDFNSILERAPLELRVSSTDYPEYLIVNGEHDSRVNKVHSYKLKASLDEFNKGKTFLLSAEHAGHWPQENYMLGPVGAKTNAIIWTRVFDYLGLNF